MTKTCPYCKTEVKIEIFGDGWNSPTEHHGTCPCCHSDYEAYDYNGTWHMSTEAEIRMLKRFLTEDHKINLLRLKIGTGLIAAEITGYEIDGDDLHLYTSGLKDEFILDMHQLELHQEEIFYHDYNKNLMMILS